MSFEYNFDKTTISGKFEIKVDTAALYGYFEHEELGDECGGGLWFEKCPEGLELTDYDGVCCLPKRVAIGLRELGFIVEEDME